MGTNALGMSQNAVFLALVAGSFVAVPIAMRAWPALARTLLAYAFAARIPVVLVMLVAILQSWGTHYDVAPPDFPTMEPLAKWFWIGVVPQLTVWIAFTVIVGMLMGGIAALVMTLKSRTQPAGAALRV
jgi:hypothetical protein